MEERGTRVLLVDDHPVVRTGCRQSLAGAPAIQVVAEAADGEEGYRLFCEHRPDVVVMDLAMPGMGGLEAIRRMLARDPDARILVFTMHDNEAMLAQAMKAGAKGYLTKQADPAMMVAAVERVAQGRPFVDEGLLGEASAEGGGEDPPLARLSPREFQVFRLIAEGYRVPEIADCLSISPKTVGVHRARIMQKLELRSAVEVVRMAVNYGVVTI